MNTKSYLRYANDTLWSQVVESGDIVYTLSIIRYRLKSRYPLVSGRIVKVPQICDFSQIPDGLYNRMCETFEFRLKYNLPLSEMIVKLKRVLRDRYLQTVCDMNN